MDLAKLIDKGVRVKLSGGREGWTLTFTPCCVSICYKQYLHEQRRAASHPATGLADARKWHAVEGVLKGYDQLLNLVLDETVEYARGTALLASSHN